MITLFQRIVTHGIKCPKDFVANNLRERRCIEHRMEFLAGICESATLVEVSNVRDCYVDGYGEECSPSDFPSCSSPWASCVLEWREDGKFYKWGTFNGVFGDSSRLGVICQVFDTERSEKKDSDARFASMMSDVMSYCGYGSVPDALIYGDSDIHHKCRWVNVVDFVAYDNGCRSQAMWYGTALVFLSSAGEYIAMRRLGAFAFDLAGNDERQIGHSLFLLSMVNVLCFSCSLANCKNVTKSTTDKFLRAPKWHRRTKCPEKLYRVLNIDPMKEVLVNDGKSESQGLHKAMHICRGHFATYTDENPLFGKVTGTFWKPQHVRGNRKQGEVIKDYSIG